MEQPAANRRTTKIARSAAKAIVAATALLLAGSLTGCDAAAKAFDVVESASSSAVDAPSPVGPASADDAARALVQLEGISVKGRAPKTAIRGTSSNQPGLTPTATVATPETTSLPGI